MTLLEESKNYGWPAMFSDIEELKDKISRDKYIEIQAYSLADVNKIYYLGLGLEGIFPQGSLFGSISNIL